MKGEGEAMDIIVIGITKNYMSLSHRDISFVICLMIVTIYWILHVAL